MISKQKAAQETKTLQNKKTYLKYSREMRLELIRLVTQQNLPTAEAARLVGIKQTSACRIMASYRKHNKIFQRKADRLCRETTEKGQQSSKTNRNQENLRMKSQQNIEKTQFVVGLSQKTSESGSDLKIGMSVENGRSPQLLIPSPCLPNLNTNIQNNWPTYFMNQSVVWNWPFVYTMF